MDEYYPELNLGKVKHSARTWKTLYPCIQNIALYLKTRTDEEDHIKYVIVVTVPEYPSLKLPDDENSWSEEELQAYKLRKYYNWKDESCLHIHQDIKTFYRDSDKAERFDWMWFNITPEEAEDLDGFNGGGEDPFIDLESRLVLYETAEKAGYKGNQHSQSYDRNHIESDRRVVQGTQTDFPELNLLKLTRIAERWAERLRTRGVFLLQISLCRYAADPIYERTGFKYVIVYNMLHYEFPDFVTALERGMDIDALLANYFIQDPYLFLIVNTNYPQWIKERLSSNPYPGEVTFPLFFRESDFTEVYSQGPRDNWEHQWLILPLFNGCDLPEQIALNEGVISLWKAETVELPVPLRAGIYETDPGLEAPPPPAWASRAYGDSKTLNNHSVGRIESIEDFIRNTAHDPEEVRARKRLERLEKIIAINDEPSALSAEVTKDLNEDRAEPDVMPQTVDSAEIQLNKFLKIIDPDIKQFYDALKTVMKDHGGMLHTSLEHARNAFQIVSTEFKYLITEDIEGDFYATGNYYRDIPGGIAQRIIRAWS